MGVGEKIKQYRMKCDMTQKDLADQLHVTNQAVSRWENDEAEPSFDTLRAMAELFDCTINDLFDMKSKEPEPIREVKIVERVVPQEAKPVLALCESCNKPIYDKEDIHRFSKRIHHGRTSEMHDYLYCTECNDARLKQEAQLAEVKRQTEIKTLKKRRLRSFVWPTVILGILLAVAIAFYSGENSETGKFYLIASFLSFFFSACLFLKNNFIGELWISIASWGFVRLPGVIMEFSIGGFIIGFIIKIILWLFGILLAILTAFLATVVGMALSVFVYPYALIKNFKQVKGTASFEDD